MMNCKSITVLVIIGATASLVLPAIGLLDFLSRLWPLGRIGSCISSLLLFDYCEINFHVFACGSWGITVMQGPQDIVVSGKALRGFGYVDECLEERHHILPSDRRLGVR